MSSSKSSKINLDVSIPEYNILNQALKMGHSWYDVMYPRNNEQQNSKKRRSEEVLCDTRITKKGKYN